MQLRAAATRAAIVTTVSVLTAQPVPAQVPLSAADSDPARMGWMVGAPPPADKLILFANGDHLRFPQLPRALRDNIDGVTFRPLGRSDTMTWAQSLEANYTDAIVVLRKGRIVYERYLGVMTPHTQHMSMSVTKSLFGTLGAMLVEERRLDEHALVTKYIPELAGSAWGDATVRQVLDMTTGLRYAENYADPDAEVWQHARAGGILPRPPGYAGPTSFYRFLRTVQKEGEHDRAFAYKTVNTDVLGWLIRRATGQTVGEVLSERIWRKLGAEQDAYLLIDSEGTEFAGGGFNATLRDLARFGEMIRLVGRYNGQQIVPRAVVDDVRHGGDRGKFAKAGYQLLQGWSYRNMWWVSHDAHGAFAARGIHGQAIYIDPEAEMVIARFGSHPLAANANLDPTSLPAFQALARHLLR